MKCLKTFQKHRGKGSQGCHCGEGEIKWDIMNITSINIRGCGMAIQRKRIRQLIVKVKVDLTSSRRQKNKMIWSNLHLKECLLKQKSRHKWIKEGDLNSRFFHGMLNMRRRRNNIVALVTGSGRVKELDLLWKGWISNVCLMQKGVAWKKIFLEMKPRV